MTGCNDRTSENKVYGIASHRGKKADKMYHTEYYEDNGIAVQI